jgi:hypothetical protein
MKFKMDAVAKKWSVRNEKWGKLVVAVECENYNKETNSVEIAIQPFELFVSGYYLKKVDEQWAMGTKKAIEVRANGVPFKDKTGTWRYNVNLTFCGLIEERTAYQGTPKPPLAQQGVAAMDDEADLPF